MADVARGFQLSFGERLTIVLSRFDSRAAASEVAGVTPEQLAKYVREAAKPPFEVMARLCAASGASLDWLAGASAESPPKSLRGTPADTYPVPLYDTRAGAGAYQLATGEEPSQIRNLDVQFLRDLGVKPENAFLMIVAGASMRDTMDDGDTILGDKSEREARDAIFVTRRGDGVLVKRIQTRSGGGLRLISDNPAFEPEDLPRDEADDLQLIGTVKFIFQRP